MKQFASFLKKEFYHISRDKWTMIILLFLPVMMLVLFGYAITTEVRGTNIAVYNPSGGIEAEKILHRLNASKYFKIRKAIDSENRADEVFRRGEAGLVIAFSEGFSKNLFTPGDAGIMLIADATDPNTATTVVNYASAIISDQLKEMNKSGGDIPGISVSVKLLYNPEMKSSFNFVPGVMGMILILICAMMTSISIAREKEKGTMEILLVSPMKPIYIIIAKALPYFALSIVNLITILLFSVFVMGVPIAGSLFWLIVVSLVFIFLSLSIGLLISSVVNSQLVALLISGLVLMMPVILLSGMMFPVESMPWALQRISEIIPARWYISAVRKLMIKGLGFSSIIKEMIILGSMTIFLLALSLKKFKIRLE